MLPPLPATDLLSHPPDSTGVDLWSSNFNWNMIPAHIGCYAFFDSDLVVYIGSACVKDNSPANIGLRQRLRFYRGRGPSEKPSGTIKKVRDYAKHHKLLLCCWAIEAPGDCRKYEDDAIRLYKPKLNWIGTRELTAEQSRIRKNLWARNRTQRLREKEYNPEQIRKCTRCGIRKPCCDFKRNASKLYGVIAVCKVCKKQ